MFHNKTTPWLLSLVLLSSCLLGSMKAKGQLYQKMCNPKAYRFAKDKNDLYLCALDKTYKFNQASNNFDLFFTKTNPFEVYLNLLQFNQGKFYYNELGQVCLAIDCDRHYFYNGTSLDSLTFYSGPFPSPHTTTGTATINSTLYFSTVNYVYKSNYTAAGTTQIYSMQSMNWNPNLMFEQIDDIKAFHGLIYIVQLHAFFNSNKCYLKMYDGNTWHDVDSCNGYITLHQGMDHLFYSLNDHDAPLPICKVAEIDSLGTVHPRYIGNSNSRFFTGNAIGNIKNNFFVPAIERDTTGLGLFPNRQVVCKINETGISSLNINTYPEAMPVLPVSYWISGATIAISNDTVMYFLANDTTSAAAANGKGNQIWVTDGTTTQKISIPGNTKDNDLKDVFYLNKSIAMCQNNLLVIFDKDGANGPLHESLWQTDRYGNCQEVVQFHPDAPYNYVDRYQNMVSFNNRIFFTGDTSSNAIQNCAYQYDYCNTASSTSDVSLMPELAVYPNPTHGLFTIKTVQLLNNADLEVHDLLGKTIYSQKNVSGNSFPLDLSSHASQLYLVEVKTQGITYRIKVIKN